jgi:hypothetical protein
LARYEVNRGGSLLIPFMLMVIRKEGQNGKSTPM